jgi:hypothetical protein
MNALKSPPVHVEHAEVEILVECHATGLPCVNRLLVPPLEWLELKAKLRRRRATGPVIPAVGPEDATDIAQDQFYRRVTHVSTPLVQEHRRSQPA